MFKNSTYEMEEDNKLMNFISLISLGLIILLSCYALKMSFQSLFELIEGNGSLLFKNNKLAIPALFLLPSFLMFFYICWQRVFSRVKEALVNKVLKINIYIFVCFILSRIAYGIVSEEILASYGYTYCHAYSSSSMYSPDIWVAKQGYCIDGGVLVSSEVKDWFEQQGELGHTPSEKEALQVINKMITDYKAQYPHIYED